MRFVYECDIMQKTEVIASVPNKNYYSKKREVNTK